MNAIWVGEVRDAGKRRYRFYRGFSDFDSAIAWLHHGNKGIPQGWIGMRVAKFERSAKQRERSERGKGE